MTEAIERFSILYELTGEKEIFEYLEAAKMDVDEEECDQHSFFVLLTKIATARLINQLAKETSIERNTLCNLFDGTDEINDAKITLDAIETIFKTFQTTQSSTPQTIVTKLNQLAHREGLRLPAKA